MTPKQDSPFKKFGDKIALVLAVAVALIGSVVIVASEGDTKTAVDQINAVSSTLKDRLEGKGLIEVPTTPSADAAMVPWNRTIGARNGLPAWMFNREPDLLKVVKKPVDTRKELFPPVDLKVEILDAFRVKLSWKADPRTTAKLEGYRVLRWLEGQDQPKKPLDEEALIESTSFTDEDYSVLGPRVVLNYAVQAVTKEDVKSAGGQVVTSTAARAALPDDREVLFHGEGNIEMAVLYVKRFHKGEWLSPPQRFNVFLGQPVGGEAMAKHGDDRLKLDFSTGLLLAEIGREIVKRTETVDKAVLDEKGRPVYDDEGNPKVEKVEREVSTVEEFVILVDNEGEPRRIAMTEKPEPVIEPPGPNDPFLDHVLHALDKRLKATKIGELRRDLYKRISFLKKQRRGLTKAPKEVDDYLLEAKKGLLYKLRWEWLLAKRKVIRFGNKASHRREADDLASQIKDLEDFLSPKGWDTEKKEWETDRNEFQGKFDMEAPVWTMPPRPKTVKNTDGKQKITAKDGEKEKKDDSEDKEKPK